MRQAAELEDRRYMMLDPAFQRWQSVEGGSLMNRLGIMLCLMALMFGSACLTQRTLPEAQRTTLRCKIGEAGAGALTRYSFTEEGLAPTAREDSASIDLCYYFDGDDCSRGALLGHDDRPGYIFPVGRRPLEELIELAPPAFDAATEVAILPLTRDAEGLAFWLKKSDDEFVLLKIASVQPTTYAALREGETATLVVEWRRREASN
jgi:hypothetical protein